MSLTHCHCVTLVMKCWHFPFSQLDKKNAFKFNRKRWIKQRSQSNFASNKMELITPFCWTCLMIVRFFILFYIVVLPNKMFWERAIGGGVKDKYKLNHMLTRMIFISLINHAPFSVYFFDDNEFRVNLCDTIDLFKILFRTT